MAEKLSELAFNREAAEVTRRLGLSRGYLLREGQTTDWGLWSARNRYAKPGGRVAAPLVSEMQARGLLSERPGGGLMLPQTRARAAARVDVQGPDGRTVTTAVNETECALGWLKWRKGKEGGPMLGEEQFAAAER